MGPLAFGRRHSPELYFFLYNGSIVFVLPYLAILWKEEGFTGSQIGLLSALRPFVSAVSGQLLVGLADARRWHFGITVVTYLVTLAARGGMALLHGFAAHLLLVLASEACQCVFMIMADASIAAFTDAAGYNRKRVLASLGWGGLAPLSGWIVGRWGVPRSIAVYFGLVSLALLPTLLLPLRELGRRRAASSADEELPQECQRVGSMAASQLGRASGVLVLEKDGDIGHLDSWQHNGHAAELAIELTDAAPLVTAAAEEAAAAAAGASPATSGGEAWSIPAVGSPLAALRSSLPPIACQHQAAAGAGKLGSPEQQGLTPAGALPARTPRSAASSASTAFYSVRSAASPGGVPLPTSTPPSRLWTPRTTAGGLPTGQPRSALLQRFAAAAGLGTPLGAGTPLAAASPAAAASMTPGPSPQLQLQPQGSLLKQVSNVSQALSGFDQSFLEGTVSDAAFLTPRAVSFLSQSAAQLGSPARRSAQAAGAGEDMREPLLQGAAASSLEDGMADEVALPISSGTDFCMEDAKDALGAGAASPGGAPELSVWAGIRTLLSSPHHAAFFATTWLMGIGFGCLGYENLYLKESGASGILLGIALVVSTCGEMPVFLTAGWWLPRLGHELAFNLAFMGWVVRLGLYTLLPFFPSPWCVLPVELLHGLTFGMAYGVGTVHAKAIAPPHLRSTTQSMFFSLYYGVGPGISGLAGGYIYQGLGMRWVFILGSATLAVGWAAIQLALRWATRAERAAAAATRKLAP